MRDSDARHGDHTDGERTVGQSSAAVPTAADSQGTTPPGFREGQNDNLPDPDLLDLDLDFEKDDDDNSDTREGQSLLLGGPASGGAANSDDDSDDDDESTTHAARAGPQEDAAVGNGAPSRTPDKRPTVRWRDLPRKGQLTVITLARLSEPLVQTSLQSYMFYQLRSFRPDLPDAAIASQAGILHASFTAAQFLTAMMWGRLADSPWFGRKKVVMIGLAGTMFSSIGFGFSQSFWQALLFRSVGGVTNGNVGVMRTMISEIIREKKYQSRAFLILPMTFNIGVIIGPILGGILSDPAHSYPDLFGHNAFLLKYPYATPNILSAFFLFSALMAIWMGLEETLDSRQDMRDLGIELRHKIASVVKRLFRRSSSSSASSSLDAVAYQPLPTHSRNASDASATVELTAAGSPESPTGGTTSTSKRRRTRYTQRLPFRRLFTRNVTLTLTAQSIFSFHMGTFNSLWFVFLSTPVYDPATAPAPGSPEAEAAHYLTRKVPFFYTGGVGLQPREVGLAMAILGCFGITMQLLLYPAVSARLGTVRSWRIFLCCFPLVHFCVPLLSLVPSASPPPHAKDGPAIWLAIAAVLLVQVVGRTFALPAQTILVNNCTPHPSVLGSLHGLAQSTGSLARTVGPMLCGYLYGLGLQHGIVAAVFWGLSAVAICGFTASLFVHEGDGHEIWLEGDVEDES